MSDYTSALFVFLLFIVVFGYLIWLGSVPDVEARSHAHHFLKRHPGNY